MIKQRIFSESGLQFEFPSDWTVLPYDAHRFYRYLSGSGLMGVDFIGIRDELLILMEVKNYSDRFDLDRYDPMENLLDTAQVQAERYFRKFKDSLRLLDIIEQYYQRKWWYRMIYLRFLRKPANYSELAFWTRAIELKRKPEQLIYILWLELPPILVDQRGGGIREYFKTALLEQLPAGTQLMMAHSADNFLGIKSKPI